MIIKSSNSLIVVSILLTVCWSLLLVQNTYADPSSELRDYYVNQGTTTPSVTNVDQGIVDTDFNQFEPAATDTSAPNPQDMMIARWFDELAGPKWLPYMHVTGKASDDRQLGRFDFMNPLWQSSDSMFFSDFRGTFDNDDNIEGNIGFGYREINRDNDWILGFYGFYDILKTQYDNKFSQGTLGIELLKTNFELRGNVYLPENKEYVVEDKTFDTVHLSGTSVIERTKKIASYERALPGFDAQVGYGFDIGDRNKLWIHGGYYNFNHSDAPEIAGPRLGLTYELNDVFGIPDSTLNIGAEYQKDDVRDTRTFACISLSIPFGTRLQTWADSKRGGDIESRMTRPVVRDVDVVTYVDDIKKEPGEQYGPKVVSDVETPLIDPASGEAVDIYFVDADGSSAGLGTQTDPMTIVQAGNASGVSDVIFLLNDDGDIHVSSISTGTLALKSYQRLMGIGDNTSKDILLPKDYTLTVNSTAGRPTLAGAGDSNVVKMLYDNIIDGITISGGNNGIYGRNINNPTVRDVRVINTAGYAMNFTNTSGTISVSNSNLQNNNLGAIYVENSAGGPIDVSIFNNNISNNTGYGFYGFNTNTSSFTGNIENNTISGNGAQGLYMVNSTESVATLDIIDNIMMGNANEGLKLFNEAGGAMTATVSGNLISENMDDNVYCYNNEGMMNLTLNNNDITDSPVDTGVRINNLSADSVFSGSITNNRITGNFSRGVYLNNAGGIFSATVQNNTINDNQIGGVHFDTEAGTSTLVIEDNVISNNISDADIMYGIYVSQSEDVNSTLDMTITGNVIENNGKGIWFENSVGTLNALLSENRIANNSSEGVYLVNQGTGELYAEFYGNNIIENANTGVWLYNVAGTMDTKFEYNTIAMNTDNGIQMDSLNEAFFYCDLGGGTLLSAGYNSIYANNSDGVDIDNNTDLLLPAKNNWWGFAPPNPARFEGSVNYEPWLTSNPN